MKEFTFHKTKQRTNSLQDYLSSRPFAKLVITTGVLVFIFVLIDRWILTVTALPQASYSKPLLVVELLKNLFASPLKALLSSLMLGFIIVSFRHLWISWSQLNSHKGKGQGQAIRIFIVFLAVILCWWFVTYDYNLYVNQSHYYDRFILITLMLLVVWRPIFILPFLLLVTSMIWQFSVPLENSYSLAQPSMPLRMLTLLVAILFARALFIFTLSNGSFAKLFGWKLLGGKLSTKLSKELSKKLSKKPGTNEWLFLSLCIIAAHYWGPALGKIVLVWFTYGHVFYLLPSTYANGWLAFLTPEQISTFASTLKSLDGFIVFTTLILQLGSLFLLWKRFTLFTLLACWTFFHVGIFATSGIFFWQWILIELAIVILIRSLIKNHWNSDSQPIPFINRNHFILSIFLIGTSIIWVNPVRLAWYDTPISYTFRLEATGESGQKYVLPPRFFTPYDYVFTLGKFEYLTPDPRLSIIWGSTGNRETADRLLQAKTKVDIFRLEKEIGQSHFNKNKSEVFDSFIRQFISNANQRGSKSTIFSKVQAPRQLWTFANLTEGKMEFDFQETITGVNVYQVTTWFDGKAYHEIENKRVRQISIGKIGETRQTVMNKMNRGTVMNRGTSHEK